MWVRQSRIVVCKSIGNRLKSLCYLVLSLLRMPRRYYSSWSIHIFVSAHLRVHEIHIAHGTGTDKRAYAFHVSFNFPFIIAVHFRTLYAQRVCRPMLRCNTKPLSNAYTGKCRQARVYCAQSLARPQLTTATTTGRESPTTSFSNTSPSSSCLWSSSTYTIRLWVCIFFLLHDFVLCIFMLGARCNNKYSEFGFEFSEMLVRFWELIWVECCCFFSYFYFLFFCILWAHFSFSSFILPLVVPLLSAHFILFFFFIVLLCAHYLYIYRLSWVNARLWNTFQSGLRIRRIQTHTCTHLHKCSTDEHPLDLLACAQHSVYRFEMLDLGCR